MCPQRGSNSCFGLERAASWATRQWGQERANFTIAAMLRQSLRFLVTIPSLQWLYLGFRGHSIARKAGTRHNKINA